MSLETREKIKASWVGADTRRAVLRERMKTQVITAETRAKMSRAAKARRVTPETRARMRAAQRRRFEEHPEERARLAEFMRNMPPDLRNSPTQRKAAQRIGRANRGRVYEIPRKFSEAGREAMRENGRRTRPSDAGRLRLSLANKRRHDAQGPSPLERLLYRYLRKRKLAFEPEKLIGRYHVDAYVAATKTVYEADGHWHKTKKNIRLDADRDAYLIAHVLVDHVVRLTRMDLQ